MLALTFERNIPAFALLKAAGGRAEVATSPLALLHLEDVEPPHLPGSGWRFVRPMVSGICGSDIAAITGHASFYMDPLTSFPFVPGHELCGRLDDGTRVVIQPVLGCAVRGIDPLCRMCAQGRIGLCENVTDGDIEVGLQTGYCHDTGGGWGEILVAHESQIYPVPDAISDEAAMLTEPLACAIHAALRAAVQPEDTVLVMGAGCLGLLTIAAVKRLASPRQLIAVAKYPHQAQLARSLGADLVVSPKDVYQRVRYATQARRVDTIGNLLEKRPVLLGGADVVFECAGSASSLEDSIRLARGGGKVILVGMPGKDEVDWAPIWQRELQVMGAYAYGVEANGRRTFDMALEMAPELKLERLAGPFFPLEDYREAIEYAMSSGKLSAVRVAFDLRES
ncbi:MAG: zinc-binding dehydrogenase [Candidatus Dormibacteraceae bacterium]